MELREKIARGLCGRQVMPEQQRQRFVLAKLVEVFRLLATGRPQRQQAFRHFRGAQAPLAALQLDLPVDHRRRPGLAERLDHPGPPCMPGNQPRLQFAIDLEIQPRRHSLPPHPAGETYHPPRTKAESTTSLPDRSNPNPLAGDQGRRRGLDKGQRPGTSSTLRSTARKGWITHFHLLRFQKSLKSTFTSERRFR